MRPIISMRYLTNILPIALFLLLAPQLVLAADNLQSIRQAAEVDQSAKAQYKLGLRYLQGNGVNKDEQSAAMWLKRAAGQNYAPAQYKMSELYRTGTGVDANLTAAIENLTDAAEQGHATAQYKLGIMYLNGDGIEKDAATAREWLELAAEHGHEKARQALADLDKAEATAATETLRPAAPKQPATEAVSPIDADLAALTQAAEKGDAEAQFQLGEHYRNGIDVSRSSKEAAKWYKQAAQQGQAKAQYQLGELYSKGRGVKRNKKIAQKWYKAAAEQGHIKAKYRLRGCGYC